MVDIPAIELHIHSGFLTLKFAEILKGAFL